MVTRGAEGAFRGTRSRANVGVPSYGNDEYTDYRQDRHDRRRSWDHNMVASEGSYDHPSWEQRGPRRGYAGEEPMREEDMLGGARPRIAPWTPRQHELYQSAFQEPLRGEDNQYETEW